MNQPNLFDAEQFKPKQTSDGVEYTPDFDGRTYERPLDHARLNTALGRIYSLMSDGAWRTLGEIAQQCECSEAGASARLRDFRKDKFQKMYRVSGVESRRITGGRWMYRVVR